MNDIFSFEVIFSFDTRRLPYMSDSPRNITARVISGNASFHDIISIAIAEPMKESMEPIIFSEPTR